ncbi:MAG TPA: MopE-related protein, partial [Flavilitoribacter sp.]|nr:MopE-related protein [Flavilitoribacter sp.]
MAPMFTKVFTGVFKNPNRTRLSAFLITALLVLGSLDSQAQFTIPLCSTTLQVSTFPSGISCGTDPCTFSWTGSPGLNFSCTACDETTISSSTPGVYSATLHFNNGALNFTVTLGAVDADLDGYLNCDDCNDNNALEKPGQIWYKDTDNDGYGDALSGPITQCARPEGYKLAFELVGLFSDCNDNDGAIHPGAAEVCDGQDNNCNNMTDEGVGGTYYRDADNDGYGNPAVSQQACSAPPGYVSNNADCNDNSVLEKPGQVWYKDSDNDGYGATGAAAITQCLRPSGYKTSGELMATSGDCNDNNAAINPGSPEICDGIDNNCNNMTDEGVGMAYFRDADSDGYGDPAVTQQACSAPSGYVSNSLDCNDNSALEKPGQVWYKDSDNDGYAATGAAAVTQCLRPSGYKTQSELTATTGDCNDNDLNIHPNAVDDVCNGIDEDCSGTPAADNAPPTAICRNATVQLDAGGNGSATAAAIDNGSNDNCGIASLSLSRTGFNCADVGTNSVTLTVTDNSNNTSTCQAVVTVEDKIPPVVECRDVTVQLDEDGYQDGYSSSAGVLVSWSDNCAVAGTFYVNFPAQFTCGNVGVTPSNLTLPDVNGNEAICNFLLTVEDNFAPAAHCQDVTVQLDASGAGTASAAAVDNGSSDACGIQSTVLSRQSFSCADIGANAVTLTVTDNNSNVSTCSAIVTVEDNVPPTALCRNVTVQLDDDGNGSTTVEAVDNGSNDACGIQSTVLSGQSFGCGDVGANTVTLTVTDVKNNVSTCSSTVMVEDNAAPAALCRNVTVQLDASGNGFTTAEAVDNGSSDACGVQSAVLSRQSFTCSDVGANTVTLTVTDIHNNVSTCQATVTVEDNVAPTALCQNVTVQLDEDGEAATTAAAVDNGSSDACGIQSAALSGQSFSCGDVGANAVTLTVTDVNNNASTCTATVFVEDDINPVALCRNITVLLDGDGQGEVTAQQVDNGSSDACGILTLELNQTKVDCNNVGSVSVTLTATDINGNEGTCSATVSVVDPVA